MSNKIQPLKLYKKDNKFYGLSDMTTDEWSDDEIIYFAQQLEKYGVTPEFSGYESEYSDHARLNDYQGSDIRIRESCGFEYEDFEIDFNFREPDGEWWDDIVYFAKPITPDKVKLIQKNCFLEPEERGYLGRIMQELGLPTDEASIDKEIADCVGLYEFIEI